MPLDQYRHLSSGRTNVTYKPIASLEQSDLEFLIHADNDT